MTDLPLPRGIALTPLDESFRSDPYPVFARLRGEALVHEDSEYYAQVWQEYRNMPYAIHKLHRGTGSEVQ